MEIIYRLPFLRICVFFILGILFGIIFPSTHIPYWVAIPAVAVLYAPLLIPPKHQYKLRWAQGVGLLIFLFVAGALRTQETKPRYWTPPEEGDSYVLGKIDDVPQKKKSTYGFPISLWGEGVPQGAKAMAYVAQDTLSQQLRDGDIILFPAWLAGRKGKQTEYESYLRRCGYSGSIFIPQGKWRKTGEESKFSLAREAREARRTAENIYRSCGLSGEELAIACALTLGDKSQLGKDLKSSYSATGASHVLAVSGLHVGIVYLVILTILKFALNGARFKKIRIILTLTALWSYAFVAGLSASVVRASVMLSLVSVGDMLDRKAQTLNTLCASAFLMLLYEPRYLTDVGFQLSYMALLSILLFQEKVYKTIQTRNYLLDKAWSLTSVSVAAQLGTMPIMMYHFHQFSNCFWLSGLIVIPAATFLIYGCAIILAASPFPVVAKFVASIISHLIRAMNDSIRWLESLPHASVGNITFNGIDVILLYAIFTTLLMVVSARTFRRIFAMFAAILIYTTYLTISKINT